jgi:hypothetical protein
VQAGSEGTAPTAVMFRLAADGSADARVYDLPTLDLQDGTIETGRHPFARAVGFASDAGVFFALDPDGVLVAVDPATDRARVVDTAVTLATVGPTGATFAVLADGTVGVVEFRGVTRWASGFSAQPDRVWGALRQRLLGIVRTGADRRLEMVAEGRPRSAQALPAGHVAVAPWGDAVAVATDSGVVVLDPADAEARRFVPIPSGTRFVEFSASGHRLFVVDNEAALRVLERFELDELDRIPLPEPGRAVRRGANGERLFVQAAGAADTVRVVDLIGREVVASLPGTWDDQFPLATPDGTILLRRGDHVVTISSATLEPTDSVPDPSRDHWLLATWDPRLAAPELEQREVPESPAPGNLLYVQVSSTSNEAWAADLAASLVQAGVAASVLPPTDDEKRFRVVVGPYATREEAEAIRRRLNLPSWIFALDTAKTTP